MIAAAALALGDILSPRFRGVLLRSVALTVALLIALWALITWVVAHYLATPWPWLDTAIDVLSGIGLLIGLGFLVAPVTALVAGFFLDDIADAVEREHYPAEPPGRPQPLLGSVASSIRFMGVVLLVNLVALPLVLLLGFGFVIFLVANAYLLGREFFELAALRHHEPDQVRILRQRNSATVFGAGLLIAAFVAIPVVNLAAPLFATALMVHVAKRVERRRLPGPR